MYPCDSLSDFQKPKSYLDVDIIPVFSKQGITLLGSQY